MGCCLDDDDDGGKDDLMGRELGYAGEESRGGDQSEIEYRSEHLLRPIQIRRLHIVFTNNISLYTSRPCQIIHPLSTSNEPT